MTSSKIGLGGLWWEKGRWAFVCVWLLVLVLAGACREKTKERPPDLAGQIILERPAEGKQIGPRLTIKAQLFDSNGLQEFVVLAQKKEVARRRWERGKEAQTGAEVELSFKTHTLPAGEQKLLLRLTDRQGYTTERRLKVVVDRQGPRIELFSPEQEKVLQGPTNMEVQVTDPSGIKEVSFFSGGKLLKKVLDEPYRMRLEPSAFLPGKNRFRAEAVDSLGNKTVLRYVLRLAPSQAGQPCGKNDLCAPGSICVKEGGSPLRFCRRLCSEQGKCPSGYRCRSLGKKRVCLPRKKTRYVQAFGICGAGRPCVPGTLCIRVRTGRGQCRPRCGGRYGRCPKGFTCRLASLGGAVKRVCLVSRKKKKARLRQIGETCGKRFPCVKGALCIRLDPRKPARCERACKHSAGKRACPSGQICIKIQGEKRGVCRLAPKKKRVGLHQSCGKFPCQKGLVCVSRGGKQHCHTPCAKAYSACGGGGVCFPLGDKGFCLNSCNPRRPSCPGKTSCLLLPLSSTRVGHFCF